MSVHEERFPSGLFVDLVLFTGFSGYTEIYVLDKRIVSVSGNPSLLSSRV